MITMDSKSQLTVDIVAKVAEGKIDIVNAAKLLNKSRRTVERYLQRYRQIGIQFIVHQNSGKAPSNKSCGKTKRLVRVGGHLRFVLCWRNKLPLSLFLAMMTSTDLLLPHLKH